MVCFLLDGLPHSYDKASYEGAVPRSTVMRSQMMSDSAHLRTGMEEDDPDLMLRLIQWGVVENSWLLVPL